jgi:monovalent cation:H+ antiporter-2, CPA2 family
MDATTTFVADITVALIAGSIAGAAARALRVTPIIGYMAAGVVIGPFTPGYIAQGSSLSGLAELGLIFLLFSLGLGFSLRDLAQGGVRAVIANLTAMAVAACMMWIVAAKLGMEHPITLALAFTVSSTAVGAALLQALGVLNMRAGRIAINFLITQDLIAVMVLVIISTPATSLTIAGVGIPLVRAVVFVAIALVLGATLLHQLFVVTLERASSDMLVVIFSAIALAAAWLGHAAGLTFEFGAFVAGAVTSEAAGSRMVDSVVRPFRQLFVMVFFVSMGTLVDVNIAILHWPALAVIVTVAVIVRGLLWAAAARGVKLGAGSALALGTSLLPMGEFNIVLGNASYAAGRLNQLETAVLISTCVLSIAIAALCARVIEGSDVVFDRIAQPPPPFERDAEVTIIGYGRVGRTVAHMLRESGIEAAIIERDPVRVREAQGEGFEAAYGDGGDPHVLEHLISRDARVVLVTIVDSALNVAGVRWLRSRRHVRTIVRAQSPRDVSSLLAAGAAAALVPEVEGARAFGHAVLGALRKDEAALEPQE